MGDKRCIVCGIDMGKEPVERPEGKDAIRYPCPNCGSFLIDRTTCARLETRLGTDSKARAILSHAIWRMHKNDENAVPEIGLMQVKEILNNEKVPSPAEQVHNLILWLGHNCTGLGDFKLIEERTHRAKVGAVNEKQFAEVWRTMLSFHPPLLKESISMLSTRFQSGLGVAVSPETRSLSFACLTFEGWERHDELKRSTTDSRRAFMAMKFGVEEMDRIFRDCLRPAVEAAGFELRKLDDEPKAGILDVRMEVEIRSSRFLVADLTHENKGVYWEAGFASGLGKPVFYTCRDDMKGGIHFDTNHRLFIPWNPGDDEASKAATQLTRAIQATLPTEAKMPDD